MKGALSHLKAPFVFWKNKTLDGIVMSSFLHCFER